jgi:hypothetical protein
METCAPVTLMRHRVGVAAAFVGGTLRAAASFAPGRIQCDLCRETLYLAVDACLATALLGIYSRRSERSDWWSIAGLALAWAGIATIRANRLISVADLYPAGALAISSGVVIFSVRAWLVNQVRGWVPAVFMLSMLLGLVGGTVQGAGALFVWSGLMFGAAFAGLGAETWTSISNSYHVRLPESASDQPGRPLIPPSKAIQPLDDEAQPKP